MAFDGLVISELTHELQAELIGGRISKIYQPEPDALHLIIKNNHRNYRLLISASASLPLIYLTNESFQNPITAPNFCMLLRKHLLGGRILHISQPQMERILRFEIEHLDELGDLKCKYLIVELMGKHSNIIFTQPDDTIIDSIKRISSGISSVREVLPGRTWFIPQTTQKMNPLTVSRTDFMDFVLTKPADISRAIYSSLTGISPIAATEICYRAGIDSSRGTDSLSEAEKTRLYESFEAFMDLIRNADYTPNIIYRDGEPIEFSCVPLTCFSDLPVEVYPNMSELLQKYYSMRNKLTRIRQKSADLRHVVGTALDRTRKKYQLQLKQLEDTKKKEKYRVYGELINTYGYELPENAKVLTCVNYYTNKEITIPLDPQLTPAQNAKKYFDRYDKLKRTSEALETLTVQTKEELDHLESIRTSIDQALYEEDLTQIREELIQYGYLRSRRSSASGTGKGQYSSKSSKGARQQVKSKPYHYISSDGYDIFVGKNNFQNEELTFELATGNDWWFHAKGIPGSHVIVKANNQELPDRTFEEAAALAAYYSQGRSSEKVEIDYIQKKHIKKVKGARPGFVIYHTNYSMAASPHIEELRQITDPGR